MGRIVETFGSRSIPVDMHYTQAQPTTLVTWYTATPKMIR